MALSLINYFAVVVSTILTFVIGFIWYGPFLGKTWMKEIGLTEEDAKKASMIKVFGTAFVLTFIMSWNLAAFIGPKADFAFWIICRSCCWCRLGCHINRRCLFVQPKILKIIFD